MICVSRVFALLAIVVLSPAYAQSATTLDLVGLEAAEKHWNEVAPLSYTFTFRYGEFISKCNPLTFHGRVVDGVPKRSVRCPDQDANFSTVPLIFAYLRNALRKPAHSIQVTFDGRYGFPARAFISWSGLTDDFSTLEIPEFAARE
jgi:hypothetical protein